MFIIFSHISLDVRVAWGLALKDHEINDTQQRLVL